MADGEGSISNALVNMATQFQNRAQATARELASTSQEEMNMGKLLEASMDFSKMNMSIEVSSSIQGAMQTACTTLTRALKGQ